MTELTDLVDALTKLDANVIGMSMKDILDEFFKRCTEATPQQVELFA